MKYAIIENGVVTNLALSDYAVEENWIAFDDGVAIGDLWDGSTFSKQPPAPPSLEELKAKRAEAVSQIKVTTASGNTFDGDETSINRITAAITVLTATGGSIPWVLADSSVVSVTAAELTEALALAAAEVARLWVLPYEQAN